MATGIWPLNPWHVIRKLQPAVRKRRDTLGTLSTPRTAWGIRNRVRSGVEVLNQIALLARSPAEGNIARDRFTGLLRELGHQLEAEIAEKELYIESNRRLQGKQNIFNTTDKRQLSVARVLNGTELIRLRDARLAKDAKKPPGPPPPATKSKRIFTKKQATQTRKKPPPTPSTHQSPPRIQEVVICDTPTVVFLDLSQEESDDEQLSDDEWNSSPATSALYSKSTLQPATNTKLLPDHPLHMSLRSCRQ